MVPTAPFACEDGIQSAGAHYRICMPAIWNGDLVVYVHGYVAPTRPVGIPEDQMVLPNGSRIDEFVTSQGYAFATTSFRTNGLAVLPAQDDLIDLVNVFTVRRGAARKVLLAGVSEGGLIAALLAERRGDLFAGALAMCGPYGDFRRQIDYIGDFRTVFDWQFPGLLPPSPVDVPDALRDAWETSFYSQTVQPAITDPANSARLLSVLAVTQTPLDGSDSQNQVAAVERLLWYNVLGTTDASAKLGGQPFDNAGRQYTGSGDDGALNAGVARFGADAAALAAIDAGYQTSGRLAMPVVTLHTTGDPLVPFWHMVEYRAKVEAAGAAGSYEQYAVARYGHCTFTAVEVLGAFNRLVVLAEAAAQRKLYLPLVGR
jgi:pimeloyl-ACP methyl ester carboxylesterase